MTNMTAYEMLSGFINYFMYNATDFTKKDVASALSKLSGEFNDTTTVYKDLNDRVKLLESALKYSNSTVKWVLPLIKTAYDSRIVEEVEEMLKKTNEVLK